MIQSRNLHQLLLPKVFEWYQDDFRVYVYKKYGKKYPLDSNEWVKHLIDIDISGGLGENRIMDNPYVTLRKITKSYVGL